MDLVLSKWSELSLWYDAVWEVRDKRMDNYPLMSNPLYTVFICAAYVYAVKIAGPNYMKDRQPYNIKSFLVIYNAFQVVFSGYIFIGVWNLTQYTTSANMKACSNYKSFIYKYVLHKIFLSSVTPSRMVGWIQFSLRTSGLLR